MSHPTPSPPPPPRESVSQSKGTSVHLTLHYCYNKCCFEQTALWWETCDTLCFSLPCVSLIHIYIYFFNLTYSQWTSLPSCLWSLRIFPSLPGSRLTIFYRDASSAILQLVNQWLNFTYSRSHAFSYGRKNTNPTLVRIELTTPH